MHDTPPTIRHLKMKLELELTPEQRAAYLELMKHLLKLRVLQKLRTCGPFLFPTVEVWDQWGSTQEHAGQMAMFRLIAMKVPKLTAGYKVRLSAWHPVPEGMRDKVPLARNGQAP